MRAVTKITHPAEDVAVSRVGSKVLLGIRGCGHVRLRPREAAELGRALLAVAGDFANEPDYGRTHLADPDGGDVHSAP
jgi:hypothetical protein